MSEHLLCPPQPRQPVGRRAERTCRRKTGREAAARDNGRRLQAVRVGWGSEQAGASRHLLDQVCLDKQGCSSFRDDRRFSEKADGPHSERPCPGGLTVLSRGRMCCSQRNGPARRGQQSRIRVPHHRSGSPSPRSAPHSGVGWRFTDKGPEPIRVLPQRGKVGLTSPWRKGGGQAWVLGVGGRHGVRGSWHARTRGGTLIRMVLP